MWIKFCMADLDLPGKECERARGGWEANFWQNASMT